ncbi:phosphatidate phosphatase LPIN1 isoform X2 [Prorops nasuta]
MKLGDSGEAFFVEEVISNGFPSDTDIPPHLACSPIPNDNCFSPLTGFNVLSNLPTERREKLLEDSVISIEREKWEQMSNLPPDQREQFLIEQFSDLPVEHREKWLQIASLSAEERDEMFKKKFGTISTLQKQKMILEQYSALKIEDKERLFKDNFPELPPDQRQKFEKALLSNWKIGDDEWIEMHDSQNEEEIFNMEGINEDESHLNMLIPTSSGSFSTTEGLHKISAVGDDFRTMVNDLQSVGKEKSSDESNTSEIKQNTKDEMLEEMKNINSSKKRRKRRSVLKKKGSQRKTSNVSCIPPEFNESAAAAADHFGSTPAFEFRSIENSAESLMGSLKTTSKRLEIDFHFFSDTEVTKNQISRPSSPVQSDTEFEIQKLNQEGNEREDDKSHQQSWKWGELPSPLPDTTHPSVRNSRISSNLAMQPSNNFNTVAARRSMLSGMFSFMKKTSRVRHNPESEGIYLSDLNADELDPEVAALYFPSAHRRASATKQKQCLDEGDTKSGNGPSLPQSPNTVEGVIGGAKSVDSDFEEPKQIILDGSIDVSLSLCGGLDTENGPSEDFFQRNLLQYEDICADFKLFENPNLVVKINGKFYNWTMACPIIITYAAYQKYLPRNCIENLCTQYVSLPMHEVEKPNSGKPETRSSYSSWFSWRRSVQPTKSSDQKDQNVNLQLASQPSETSIDMTNAISVGEIDSPNRNVKIDDSIEFSNKMLHHSAIMDLTKNEEDEDVVKEAEGYSGSEDSDCDQDEIQGVKIPIERRTYYESTEKCRKTLRLSSTQIASLDLNGGANEVVFSVTTAYQGTTRCKCHIYKWKWDDKIVISDIDGTITKSDVLGHILPIVGKDWAQSGVAQLFTKIKNNGYKLLYLSARAIGQAKVTREYLKSIKQGNISLPEGPLLLNPTSLISAFHREVIEKKPEEFKISCLSDIQALFPEGTKPFYAGYGNRINDVWAYRAVGIPTVRIFTINHRGELKHELTKTFQSSYSNMSFIVDHLFPAWREDAADEFSNFVYWREPIVELPKVECNFATFKIT